MATGTCSETIFKRHFDVWYKPAGGPGQGWTYAINCLNSYFLSSKSVLFSPDFGYQFDSIKDQQGRDIIGWSGETGWRICSQSK